MKERNEKQMLTVSNIATKLNVNRVTVHRLIVQGQLPAIRVGSIYRIKESDLEDYMEKAKVQT